MLILKAELLLETWKSYYITSHFDICGLLHLLEQPFCGCLCVPWWPFGGSAQQYSKTTVVFYSDKMPLLGVAKIPKLPAGSKSLSTADAKILYCP